ncbi:hypothetical protein [Bosea sp. PAMC 26642]|uniref:hypothetical protein n=1 Tax=Bosea sp. (strain PAMC 26642) TaxID=1792307 RepID=UPI0007700907|nr:hypothetical protein [Bosea sp. PAMC 26642]AMJ63060.1 hypothetical protein AXW83_24630 [Bosea sp. PAMC 26642]
MTHKKMNPKAPCRAAKGSGTSISSPAINSDNITTALALKRILARVTVSPSVALVIAAHAGFLPEGRIHG